MLLNQAFNEASLKNPRQIAVLDLGVSLTFGELRKRIGQLSYLYQSELQVGKPVAIMASNGFSVVQTFFALSNIGIPVLFFDPKDSEESIIQDLKILEIDTILLTQDQMAKFDRIKRASNLSLTAVEIQKKKGGEYDPSYTPPPDRPLKDSDIVLIQRQEEYGDERRYSFFSHKQIYVSTASIKKFYRLTPSDRILTTMSWSHPFALTHGMLLPLFVGSTCVADPQSPTIEEFIEYLAKERISRFVGPPKFYFELLSRCASQKYKLPGVKSITVGMGSLSLALRKTYKLLKIPVLRCYGRSEALWSIAMDELETALEIESAKSKPASGMKAKVLNSAGDEVPGPGVREGRLAVMGESVMTSLYHPDKESAAKATRNKLRGTWFYTEEIARLEGEAETLTIAVLGKDTDMILTPQGYLSPRKIDEIAKEYAGVADAAGFVRVDRSGERSFACAVIPEGKAVSENDLLRFLRDRLPKHYNFTAVYIVDSIPRDEFESVNRQMLQKLYY